MIEIKDKDKIVADLCGGSGAWSKDYEEAEYIVINVTLPFYDVLKTVIEGDYIIFQGGTARPFKARIDDIYGVLAAIPCTEFAISGARWWKNKDPKLLVKALKIFDMCMTIIIRCEPHFWALENPVGRLKKLRYKILGEPKLIFHPFEYGDAYTKKTLIWGKFNIPIKNEVEPEYMTSKKGYKYSPIARWFKSNKGRQRVRSITPAGFAKAFFEENK